MFGIRSTTNKLPSHNYTHLRCDIFEIGVIAVELLERSVHLLAWLCVIIAYDALHLNIMEHVLM